MSKISRIIFIILLFALAGLDVYLIIDNVLLLIHYENHQIVIRNYHYDLITVRSAIFFTMYSLLFLVGLIGIFYKKYWSFLLINILSLPPISILGIGITKSFIEKDPIDRVFVTVFLLMLLLFFFIYSGRTGLKYVLNRKAYLVIAAGILVLIGFLDVLVIRT